MPPVIQEVLDQFDRWDGSLEREYIASQQRKAPPVSTLHQQGPRMHGTVTVKPRKTKIRSRILDVMEGGGWMTSYDVAIVTGIEWRQVQQAITYLLRLGGIEVRSCIDLGKAKKQYRVSR
jgi:hypothetical protein